MKSAVLVIAAFALGVTGFWMTAVDAGFFVDRPFLYLAPNLHSTNYLSARLRALTHPEVVLAATAFAFLVPAILLGALGLARSIAQGPFEALGRRLEGRHRWVVGAAAAVAMSGAAFVAFRLVKGAHTIDDENAYEFQARLFAHGALELAEPPHALKNPMLLTDGMWTSKYPPGHSLLLALGSLAGDERVVPIAMAGLLVAFTWMFVKNAFGPRQALLAAALMAASPAVWAQYGTIMSFATSACAMAAFLAALSAAARSGRALPAYFAGAALGWVAITRPLEAFGLGLPALAMLAVHAARGLPAARARFVAVALGGASVVWILLAHDYAITGSPFHFPYQLDPTKFSFGFRRVFHDEEYVHTPHAAFANLVTVSGRIDLWMLAWPASSLLVLAGLVRSRRTPFDRLLAMMLASFVLSMAFVYSSGTWDFGPTYYFVCFPLLVPIAVRGIHWLVAEAKAAGAPVLARMLAWVPIVGAVACAIAIAPVRFMSIAALSAEVRAPWELVARETKDRDVLVALPPPFRSEPGFAFGYPYTIRTGPRTTAKLFRASSPAEHDEAVRFLGPNLPVYALSRDEQLFAKSGVRAYSLRVLSPGKP